MILVLSILLLIAESVFPLHLNSNRVDTIQNGWIELMQLEPVVYNKTATSSLNTNKFRDSIRFEAKCNENYLLNSNSSEVMPVKLSTRNSWIPVNDYLVQGLALCSRDCAFQSSLANGFIQIEANPKAILKDNALIKAYENSQVKFRCFDGYKLRSIAYKQIRGSENNEEDFEITSIVYKGKALIEKCGPNGTESAFINEFDNQTKFVSQAAPDDQKLFHQCVKECSLFQTDFAEMNGFLVPARHQYQPGDQLQFLCKEGYVAEMPVIVNGHLKEYQLSNSHTLECSLNGTWHFIPQSKGQEATSNNPMTKYYKTGQTNAALKALAKCSTMESLMHKQRAATLDDIDSDTDWSLSTNNSRDLNLRTFAMMFGIGACIMLLLLTTLITMRLVQRKRYNLRDLFSLPPTEPLLIPNESTAGSELRTAPAPQRSHTQAQTQLSGPMDIERSGTASNLIRHLSNAYLPTYEEAISQQPRTVPMSCPPPEQAPPNPFSLPSSQPTTSTACNSKTEHIIDETTSIIEIAPTTLQSLGLYNTSSGRSNRNAGLRSNLSIRSGGGSLRTSSSSGSTASFNLLPPSSSRHKNNIRARRLHNYKNLGNHNRNRAGSVQIGAAPSESSEARVVNEMATGSADFVTVEDRQTSSDEAAAATAEVAPNTSSI